MELIVSNITTTYAKIWHNIYYLLHYFKKMSAAIYQKN